MAKINTTKGVKKRPYKKRLPIPTFVENPEVLAIYQNESTHNLGTSTDKPLKQEPTVRDVDFLSTFDYNFNQYDAATKNRIMGFIVHKYRQYVDFTMFHEAQYP